MTLAGLDALAARGFDRLRGRRVGLVCNLASVTRGLDHALDLMLAAGIEVVAAFGPQHGLVGSTQDNMIEWQGGRDGRTGLRVHSLYGEVRKPTPEMLQGIDLLVIDLPDVGARYYTFVWTACLASEAAREAGIEALVLDRPNPLGGAIEGPVLDPAFASFVGLHPVPTRHGLTIGEIALTFAGYDGLAIEPVLGWTRETPFEATGLPWIAPSPNMPTLDTAWVYPGACLLEATNLSEGRGTCRPFETFGAPFLDAHRFAGALNARELPGCRFRAVEFEPTFNKHAGRLCGGAFLHVLDRASFRPVRTYLSVMQEAILQSGLHSLDAEDVRPRSSPAGGSPSAGGDGGIRATSGGSFLHPPLSRGRPPEGEERRLGTPPPPLRVTSSRGPGEDLPSGRKTFVADSEESRLPGFAWKEPPYEYVWDRRPIDLLFGNGWLAGLVETCAPWPEIEARIEAERAASTPPSLRY